MIADTAGALIAFLALVAPGIAFYLVRDRYTPARSLSSFREASVVALTSLFFTATAGLLLLGLAATRLGNWLPDIGAWAADGDAYFDAHVAAATAGLVAQVVLASGMAALVARLLSGQRSFGNISGVGTWFQVFRRDRPDNATPWLQVELDDESVVWGYLKHYTTDTSFEKGELTLVGPKLARKKKGGDKVETPHWYTVIIPGSKIRAMSLAYVDDSDASLRAARGARAQGRRTAQP